MSRIGKKPINVPAGVEVKIDGHDVTVKGPKGTLHREFNHDVDLKFEAGVLTVSVKDPNKDNLTGLSRTLLNNMVVGVTDGFEKTLEINGVGYRAAKQGNKLVLSMGFSHPVEFEDRDGATIEVPNPNTIVVKGINKEAIGQLCAEIRLVRPPEPYKGKGIKYADEHIIRKEGKMGKK